MFASWHSGFGWWGCERHCPHAMFASWHSGFGWRGCQRHCKLAHTMYAWRHCTFLKNWPQLAKARWWCRNKNKTQKAQRQEKRHENASCQGGVASCFPEGNQSPTDMFFNICLTSWMITKHETMDTIWTLYCHCIQIHGSENMKQWTVGHYYMDQSEDTPHTPLEHLLTRFWNLS